MILSAVSGIFCFASVLIIIAPGPNRIYWLTQGAPLGRWAGLRVTEGGCTGLLAGAVQVSFGVATIFQTTALAFIALGMTCSRVIANGLRLDIGELISGLGYASGTRAVVLGRPAR